MVNDFCKLAPWTKPVRKLRVMSAHEKIMAKSENNKEIDQNK